MFCSKDDEDEKEETKSLKKIQINNVQALKEHLTLESRIEYILNQLIEHLKIPMNKFNTRNNDNSKLNGSFAKNFKNSSSPSSTSTSYKVTFKNMKFEFEYDDEYIDFEGFERWSTYDSAKNKTPSLK